MTDVAPENLEARDAWDGVLFDRFVQFREIALGGLTPHGDEALRRHPPRAGDRALDIGCGFGDTARQLGELVGPEGRVLGIDVAPRFIETAIDEAQADGVENVRFAVADLQTARFDETFDYAFSRFGTMFIANPVAALRNVREALAPGGLLCNVVWRRKLDNPWLHRAETVVDQFVTEVEDTDEPTCGPGPFSMANADTVGEILTIAGFVDIAFERCDLPFLIGRDLEEAVAYNMAIGPAAEAIRLAPRESARLATEIEAALREALSEFETPDGIVANSSTWVITARAPS